MIAEVIVDISNGEVDRVFDYNVPSALVLKRGMRVSVPFGRRNIEGYVMKLKESSDLPADKLKSIYSSLN